jgi:uncharacterized protein (TIGR02145 family)
MKNQNNLKISFNGILKPFNEVKTFSVVFAVAIFFLMIPNFSFGATVTTLATLGIKTNGLAFDTAGNLYTAKTDMVANSILKITPAGTVTTFVTMSGSFYPNSALAAIAFDAMGNLYVASRGLTIYEGTIYKITPSGAITLFATLGANPTSLAFDATGNLYVGYYQGNANYPDNTWKTISKITPSGAISTFANIGAANTWGGLAFDTAGNLYTAVGYGEDKRIVKVTPSGTAATFVTLGFMPSSISFDNLGNLYVASVSDYNISKVTQTGTVTTFLYVGGYPVALAFDTTGNLYTFNYIPTTITKISSSINISSNISSSWTITGPETITGTGTPQTITGKPSGTYTITWGDVLGYTTPATQSFTLAAMGTISFSGIYTTNCGTVSDVDGNIYNTVVIGTKCWMAENLRTTKKPDGTNLTEGSGMYTNPNFGSGSPWGKLYNWPTAMNGEFAATAIGAEIQGICPNGWHIPSDFNASASDDFQELSNFLGGDAVAGGKMKNTNATYWTSPNVGASNSSGFASVGNGFWYGTNGFNTIFDSGNSANFWSSSERIAGYAWNRNPNNFTTQLSRGNSHELNGMSVRCVKGKFKLSINAGIDTSITGTDGISENGSSKDYFFQLGTAVTLNVAVANGVFKGWTGDCAGSGIGNSCTLIMDSDKKAGTSTTICSCGDTSSYCPAETWVDSCGNSGCTGGTKATGCGDGFSIKRWQEVAP